MLAYLQTLRTLEALDVSLLIKAMLAEMIIENVRLDVLLERETVIAIIADKLLLAKSLIARSRPNHALGRRAH